MADTGWIKEALGLDILFEGNLTSPSARSSISPSLAPSDVVLQPSFPAAGLVPTRSIGRSIFLSLVNSMFPSFFASDSGNASSSSPLKSSAPALSLEDRHSLLSNITLFRCLTGSSTLNHFIMDVIEGLLITLVLVAAFILVLLIREWVVQQQPIINMAAENREREEPERNPVQPINRPTADHSTADEELEMRRSMNLPWPAVDRLDEDDDDVDDDYDGEDSGEDESDEDYTPEPVPSEDDLFVADLEEIDLSLADYEAVSGLIEELRAVNAHNAPSPGIVTDEEFTRRCEALPFAVERTCRAFEKRTRIGIARKDLDTLEQNMIQVERLRSALQFNGHVNTALYRHKAAVLEHWTESWLEPVREALVAEEQDRSQVSDDASTTSSCSIESAREDERMTEDQKERQTPISRPRMPDRSTATRATEIQRKLQETEAQDGGLENHEAEAMPNTHAPSKPTVNSSTASTPHTSHNKVSQDQLDSGSDSSDGSWQKVYGSQTQADPSQARAQPSSSEQRQSANFMESSHELRNESRSDEPENSLKDGLEEDEGRSGARIISAQDLINEVDAEMHHTWGHMAEADESRSLAELAEGRLSEDNEKISPLEARSHDPMSGPVNDTRQSPPSESVNPHLDHARNSEPEIGKSRLAQLTDWIWGDISAPAADQNREQNDEHVVQDVDQEELFVRVDAPHVQEQNQAEVENQRPERDPEVAAAAAQAGLNPNDPEAVDDAEDLEGVMELIGVQGPLTGLFTNAMFAAVVISGTIASAIWVPFLFGKGALVVVAHPVEIFKFPLQIISVVTNLVLDMFILWAANVILWVFVKPLSLMATGNSGSELFKNVSSFLDGRVSKAAMKRMGTNLRGFMEGSSLGRADFVFDSLTALRLIQSKVVANIDQSWACVLEQFAHLHDWAFSPGKLSLGFLRLVFRTSSFIPTAVRATWQMTVNRTSHLWSDGLRTSLEKAAATANVDAPTPSWTATDRLVVIILGYLLVGSFGSIYYFKLAPIATSRQGKKIENTILDVMSQTGGILKVVMIVSIEMLVFPLYCGMLLDLAMLPLFAQATLHSRLEFSVASPWTSCFVHWFIGTCYMFHFALFVSMCRKILRRGVLYFIRDPDDPTFHPIRDVLERSVTSQLRKIGSSALIYGGLIIVCLGTTVWMLAYGITGILPIRWTNSAGILGFPVDLLLYTALKPAAMRLLTPGNGFHKLYEWCFRKCARALSLSDFLFQEHHDDERKGRRLYLGDGQLRWTCEEEIGKYVRVPASDQVRIPRGRNAFEAANESHNGGQSSPDFVKVFIPNFFRARIALFVLCLWGLTAGTGFSLTILPLILGRTAFGIILPGDLWANDVYAFSLGLCVLAASAYITLKYRLIAGLRLSPVQVMWRQLIIAIVWIKVNGRDLLRRLMRCTYTYGIFTIVMPLLLGTLTELYFVIPLHGYLTNRQTKHVIHLMQLWTLGIQYVRLCIVNLETLPNSRPGRALRIVLERGYTRPNAWLATRCFFLPTTVLFLIAALLPALVGRLICIATVLHDDDDARIRVLQLTYPAVLGICTSVWAVYALVQATKRWRMRIRDEVYLIGERLHNYGEKSSPSSAIQHSSHRL